ncbi:MAG: glycoside hydrolase [candidate division Zixibacteria bacterium]|nr:glycoside hydrolase [candidate division Zixibacteria bacterium]
MHQPYYKDAKTGQYQMPWVRLHGLKDYYDMVAVLDHFPKIRMTFNLVPSLIEQIQDYAQDKAYDEHLLLTERPAKDLTDVEKEKILSGFFNCNFQTMIYPHPRFCELFEKRGEGPQNVKSKVRDFDVQDFLDLQIWSNLVWIDPIFSEDPFISYLHKKGRNFTEEEKEKLILKQREILGKVLPKYKELQDRGQIEVTFSPYFHPIMPLICDTGIAKFALPHIQLPQTRFSHPEDVEAQIDEALKLYEHTFGRRPEGMWPSEGSVSEQIVPLVTKFGVKWIATDEEILFHSLRIRKREKMKAAPTDAGILYKPYKIAVENKELFILFRDHTLSDLIGFVYSSWNAEDAVDDFIQRLHKIRKMIPEDNLPDSVVTIILDGENCWEYYKNDGHDFLSALYSRLSEDKLLCTTTISDFLQRSSQPQRLAHLFAGSWINHNFRIWIGHPEDNLSWDFLKKTRDALVEYEKRAEKGPETEEILKKAWKEIYIAEGSDWNWWYGDEHQSSGIEEFDRIFRSHLLYVYELINQEPPKELYSTIKSRFVSTYFLPPVGYLSPTIDGKKTHYYEWQQAGFFDPLKAGGTMHQVSSLVSGIYFGLDECKIYFRVDTSISKDEFERGEYEFILELLEPARYKILLKDGKATLFQQMDENEGRLISSELEFSFSKIMELAVPMSLLQFKEEKEIWFRLIGERQKKEIERWPAMDVIRFDLPSQKGEPIFWEV